MDRSEWQAEQFELVRPHLRAVAQRMLGSAADAEDAVQETWLRLSAADTRGVENMRAWLTTVTSRICLDVLRARRTRREELVDGWFPEPVVALDTPGDPEQEALLGDSVGLALLVLLDALAPAERLAFVLHDLFGMPFDEIAPIVQRSVPATRQLASRARRRVQGASVPDAGGRSEQRRVVEAFLAAARNGDFAGLVAVLDPDVQFHVDAGALAPAVPAGVRGAEQVARVVLERGRGGAPFGRPALVDGRPGAVVAVGGEVRAVVAFTIAGGRVTQMDLLLDPVKLRNVRL